MKKYVLCRPSGGFQDNLCQMEKCYNYCKKWNRSLLIDTLDGCYKVSFDENFYFENSEVEIICNSKKIRRMILERRRKRIRIKSITDEKYQNENFWKLDNDFKEEIIYYRLGGGSYFPENILKILRFDKKNLENFWKKYNTIVKPYLSIYVRNTDIQNDYKKFYDENKNLINKYRNIFIATDDKNVVNFYRKQNLNIYSFTTFPKSGPVHYSEINGNKKIQDMICDLLILGLSENLLTNSRGYFKRLAQYFFNNKDLTNEKINYSS